MIKQNYKVKPVSREDCKEYILDIHYAHRWPMIQFAFGLFLNGKLCGVSTYGVPSSQPLRDNIAGTGFSNSVLELTRLCLKHNRKNEASILVGKSIKLLPQNRIIVSFADTSQDHIGCIYQATNFMYTGLSVPREHQKKVRGLEHKHILAITMEFRGLGGKTSDHLKAKYGDRVYSAPLSRKHRYIYLHGSRKFKKQALLAIKYKLRPYPKRGQTIKELEELHNIRDGLDIATLAQNISPDDFNDLII